MEIGPNFFCDENIFRQLLHPDRYHLKYLQVGLFLTWQPPEVDRSNLATEIVSNAVSSDPKNDMSCSVPWGANLERSTVFTKKALKNLIRLFSPTAYINNKPQCFNSEINFLFLVQIFKISLQLFYLIS